jgi:hypothetical protein
MSRLARSMTVARQQAAQAQFRLFDESDTGPARHPESGDAGSEAGTREALQAVAARAEPRALPTFVMEEVADPANLNQAYTPQDLLPHRLPPDSRRP